MTIPSKRYIDAVERGAHDYLEGVHLNPYDHATENEGFRGWIEGYNAAKATDELRKAGDAT